MNATGGDTRPAENRTLYFCENQSFGSWFLISDFHQELEVTHDLLCHPTKHSCRAPILMARFLTLSS